MTPALDSLLAQAEFLCARMDSMAQPMRLDVPAAVLVYMHRTIRGHRSHGGYVPRPPRIGTGAELQDLIRPNVVGSHKILRTKV